jgi:type IV pilus assembly protein PilC
MGTFSYTAKDKSGKTVIGVLDAPTEVDVAEILHKQSLIVLSVEVAKKQAGKLDDIVIFSRQLATMIDSGIPLVQALAILAEQIEAPGLKRVVSIVQRDIEGGTSFCDALGKHPQVFSGLFINMARAGETSGMLADVLDRLATYLEKSASLNRKVQSSLVYPVAVIIIAGLITAVLLLTVVPTFKGIFISLGGTLPLPTLILIGISDILRKWFLLVLVVLIASIIVFKKYISTVKGRYNFDNLKLHLPVFGDLFRKLAVARFSRTFSTLTKSGVAVLNALDIVAVTSGNKVIEETVMASRAAVREGEPIHQHLSKTKIFPPMVCRMIAVGEQTGQLEKMLSKIADFYDEQVDTAVAGMTSLIEPMVIVFLGVIVGGIVIALFMPIFKITEIINK